MDDQIRTGPDADPAVQPNVDGTALTQAAPADEVEEVIVETVNVDPPIAEEVLVDDSSTEDEATEPEPEV